MKKIISEKILRIIRNRKKLQKILDVEITNRGKEVFIEGKPEDEFIAEGVIEALNFGFPFSTAILIKEQGFLFEILNIKNYTKSNNLKRIKARIIGKKGSVLKTLSELTEGYFEIEDNKIGIISEANSMINCQNSIVSIIRGAKQAKVYSFLERHKIKIISDLGLRDKKF